MSKNTDCVSREYYCRICDQMHQIKISKNIVKSQSKFPFPFIFLHGDLKNLLTTLYIDKEARIRGVDVHELSDDNIFSKDQVIKITTTLLGEIERLQRENARLNKLITNLKKRND